MLAYRRVVWNGTSFVFQDFCYTAEFSDFFAALIPELLKGKMGVSSECFEKGPPKTNH